MSANRISWLSPGDPADAFPPIDKALTEPDGLLAAGGDLSAERLLEAYRRGIFPWFDEGQPILWWSPDPRCVLYPQEFHISRRLLREIRADDLTVTFNKSFADVMQQCAEPRPGQPGTWITDEMRDAYGALHSTGWAHSVEIRDGAQLIGGLYGVAIGRVFFGESMFSDRTNSSKKALFALSTVLRREDFALIDCQVASVHLTTLGARLIPRPQFQEILATACNPIVPFINWPNDESSITAFEDD